MFNLSTYKLQVQASRVKLEKKKKAHKLVVAKRELEIKYKNR